MINSENKIFWNTLKGIGILSIVIGHSCHFLKNFVYLYHLALFFFIGGYLYREERYGDDPYGLLVARIKSNWKKYVIYCLFFLLIHNLIYFEKYNFEEFISTLIGTLFFLNSDVLAGALWFVPVYIVSSVIFGTFVYYSRKWTRSVKEQEREKLKNLLLFIFTFLCGLVGVYITYKKIAILYHFQTCFLVVPFFTLGYYLKTYIIDLKKILKIYIAIPIFIILLYFAFYNIYIIELSIDLIGNSFMFYIISFMGIYLCLYVAKIFTKILGIRRIFNYIGKYSFEIMTFHLLVFKIIDLIYYKINNFNDVTLFNRYPYLFDNLWPLYVLLGTLIPTVVFFAIDKIKSSENTKNLAEKFKLFLVNKINSSNHKKTFIDKKDLGKFASKIVLLIGIFLFSNVFIGSFFFPSSVYYKENNFISLLICFILFLILYIIYIKHVKNNKRINTKTEFIIVSLIFTIIFLLELFVLKYLSVKPGWDFAVVFENANSYVLNGARDLNWYPAYFEMFPNNIFLFAILIKVIRIGSILLISPLKSAWCMNIIFINISYFMLYLTLRKKFGVRISIFGLIISLMFIAPILYTPIFYTDTMSLFVGISFLYAYLSFNHKNVFCTKNIIIFVIIGILLFYGKAMKITSLIPFIAIIISLIFDYKKRKLLYGIALSIIVLTGLNILYNYVVVNNKQFAFKENGYGAVPYTHWVMMGVEDVNTDNSLRNSYGGYNYNDFEFTLNHENGKSAVSDNIQEYFSRVHNLGFNGYYTYLVKKSVNAWTDGLYYVDVKLKVNNYHKDEGVYNIVLSDGVVKDILIHFSQGVQYLFILSFLIGAMIKYYYNSKKIDIVRLSIIGLLLFLLLWENRSRYLLNFIPLFVYVICEFIIMMSEKKDFIKKLKKLDN